MLTVMVLMGTALVVPPLVAARNDEGLPSALKWLQILTGIGYGSLMWLDLDLTRDNTQFRWITLAMVFAVSAVVLSGLSGVNSLSKMTLVPMCVGASSALLVADQPIMALSVAVFAGIALRSLSENDKLWVELIVLRIRSNRVAEENLWAATHDPLTGLLNRSGVMQHLAERADEPDHPISLMFIDLDHFKEVNDRFGHAGGEFVVAPNAAHDKTTSARLANRIIDELELPMAGTNGDDIYLSASVGIATLAPSEATPEQSCWTPTMRCTGQRRQGAVRSPETSGPSNCWPDGDCREEQWFHRASSSRWLRT